MKLLFSLAVIAWLLTACTTNSTYKRANKLYKKENYVAAIKFYDEYLEKDNRGISSIFSELERSDSYYQLGLKAYEKKNWLLAQKLFFLANSETADQLLDNCFYYLADAELENENKEKAIEYYDYILLNLPTSDLIPQILINKIKLNIGKSNEDEILVDYKRLYLNYPECDTSSYVSDIVDTIIRQRVISLKEALNKDNYVSVLNDLLDLADFPTNHKQFLRENIAQTYLFIADIQIERKEYDNVVTNLQKALDYDPAINSIIEAKLEQTFGYFVIHGNQLADQLLFDDAIDVFDQCLALYPEYSPAKDARKVVEKKKWNYLQSAELMEKAIIQEEKKEYKQALKLYKEAEYYFQTQELSEKVFTMNNLLKAEKDPQKFALELVRDYKSGKITSKINSLVNDLKNQFGENLVKVSEWDVQYSTGNYKYEVRLDILTPEVNYYFVWLADLKKGIISPLNKISEELM